MSEKSHGPRLKTRKKFEQPADYRPPITKFLQEFSNGQKVVIKQEPSSHKGMPFKRFLGKVGTVVGKRGKAYVVEVYDGEKLKKVISRPEHLKSL